MNKKMPRRYPPSLNKKIGFRLGCILGFIIPLAYIFNETSESPLAGIVLVIIPLTVILCGIMGIIAGGSYSQIAPLLTLHTINKNKNILQGLLWLSYCIHIGIILMPLLAIWWLF